MVICLLGYWQKNIITTDGHNTSNFLRLLITGSKEELTAYTEEIQKMFLYEQAIPFIPPSPFLGNSYCIMLRVKERLFSDMLAKLPVLPPMFRGRMVYAEYSLTDYVKKKHDCGTYLLKESQLEKISCPSLRLFKENKHFDQYLEENGGYGDKKKGTLWMMVAW